MTTPASGTYLIEHEKTLVLHHGKLVLTIQKMTAATYEILIEEDSEEPQITVTVGTQTESRDFEL